MSVSAALRKSLSSSPKGFEAIAGVVRKELAALEAFFKDISGEFEPQMREMVRYCLKHQGKRLRPILVFFSGAKEGGKADEKLVRIAATIELVHLATLVHDDVMDQAVLRHGFPTLNAHNGAAVAVLVGDSMFARALELATDFDTETVCKPLTRATRRVCAGEVWQTTERGNGAISLDQYFEIIEMKTGELFRVSCLLGARIGGQTEDAALAFAEFGRRLGRAYQVYDDLADIMGEEAAIGKTLGTDLASGKYTLPALLLLQELGAKQRRELLAQIQSGSVDTAGLGSQIISLGILEKVVAYFREEIAAAERALEAHDSLFAADNLRKMAAFVTAQFDKFLKQKRV